MLGLNKTVLFSCLGVIIKDDQDWHYSSVWNYYGLESLLNAENLQQWLITKYMNWKSMYLPNYTAGLQILRQRVRGKFIKTD
jgi:hypothetical protein